MKVQNFVIRYFRAKIRAISYYSKRKAGNLAFSLFCTPFSRKRYNISSLKNAETLTIDFEGLRTQGYRWNIGKGKKLLVAHGFRSAALNFQHFALKLAAKGYEVVAFDAPAHGLSQGKRLNAITYKNFLAAVTEQLGPFDGYLCHSFGGLAVSLNLAEMNNNKHIKTVLIAPAANSRQLTETFFREMRIADPEVRMFFYENIQRVSGQDIDWFSLKKRVTLIKGPVLWVHDKYDNVTPIEDAEQIRQINPLNFEFLFTRKLGHAQIYRDETVIRRIVDFL